MVYGCHASDTENCKKNMMGGLNYTNRMIQWDNEHNYITDKKLRCIVIELNVCKKLKYILRFLNKGNFNICNDDFMSSGT